jgi:hypothetical protein
MARYGNVVSPSGENLAHGNVSPTEQIVNLIIDDGVPTRGHRTNIFTAAYEDIGNYLGSHTVYTKELCQNFAVGTYSLTYSSLSTLQSNFLSAAVTWTSADGTLSSGWSGYSDSMSVNVANWKLVKVVTRTYTMTDGSTKQIQKTLSQDLPAKST